MFMAEDYMKREWKHAAYDIMWAVNFSYYNLFFPLNLALRLYFLHKTKRSLINAIDLGYIIDFILFILVIFWHGLNHQYRKDPI